MKAHRFYKSLRVTTGFLILCAALFFMMGIEIYDQYSIQRNFQTQYGEQWKVEFGKRYGPDGLAMSNRKIMVAAVAIPAGATMLFFLLRLARGRNDLSGHRRRGHHHHYRESYKW